MSYRTILVAIEDQPHIAEHLAFANDLAGRHDARLTGLHVMPPPVVPVGFGEGAVYMGPEIVQAQREASVERAEKLEKAFLSHCEPAASGAQWRLEDGDPGLVLARIARTFDLTIAACEPGEAADPLVRQPVEDIVLSGAGPVLVLPPDPAASFAAGKSCFVAWNGSREAARALKDSLPFLKRAERTVLFAAGEEAVHSLADAARFLKEHDIVAKTRPHDRASSHEIGDIILKEAQKEHAGLLVMGAYGHARWREIVLGGATRAILARTDIPVLMSC